MTDDVGDISAVAKFMMTDDCRVGHVSIVSHRPTLLINCVVFSGDEQM